MTGVICITQKFCVTYIDLFQVNLNILKMIRISLNSRWNFELNLIVFIVENEWNWGPEVEDSRAIKRRIGWPLNFSSSGAASYQEAASRREEVQMKQVEESRQHFLLAGMLKRRKLSRSAGTCSANRCPSFGWPPAPSSPTSQNKYIHPHSSTWSLSIYI